jgi:uncharacterized MAPEG superfamily protein
MESYNRPERFAFLAAEEGITTTLELKWLMYTALLAGSLWIPFIVGVNTTDFPDKAQQFIRPPDHGQMKPWVHRSLRAHQNLLEQFVPFAIIVLIGAVTRVSTPVTAACSIAFFWLRVAHAIGMISGLARLPLRPMIYFVAWIVMLVFASQVLSRAG